MKILQLDVNYDHSSTGKIVKCLQTELKAAGHECLALFGRGDFQNDADAVRISPPLEVMAHAGLTRLTGVTGYFSPISTQRVKRIIAGYRPDVLHVHEPHGYYINFESVLRYATSLNIGLVWTFHCEFGYTGKCGHALECERWKTGCDQCPQLRQYPRSEFFDATQWMWRRKAALFQDLQQLEITTPSRWLAGRAHLSTAGCHPITPIPNPLDTTVFFPRDTSKSVFHRYGIKSPFLVLIVGAQIMTSLKGGRLVQEIAKAVRRTDVEFLIVGCERHEVGKNGNVVAIERTNDKNELAQLYSAADLLLITSQKETFSMVCAESLACGTPVIGFDAGAPPEVAPQGFGRFAPYAEIATVASWIEKIEETKGAFNLPEECAQFAKNRYSPIAVMQKFLSVYEKAISRRDAV